MLFKPLLAGELSGSVGSITASHNKGGAYFRSRVVPTNPATPKQGIVRQILGNLAVRWSGLLSQAQRDAWDVYAANVPLLNRLGESITVTGLNMYQRSNVPREQNGLPRVDAAPTTFNTGEFTAPTIASITSPTALSLNFETTDAWVSEDDSSMLIGGGRPQSAAINFFKGPYQALTLQLNGEVAIPPTSPFAGVLQFNHAAGNKGFITVRVSRADGRLSQVQRLEAIVV